MTAPVSVTKSRPFAYTAVAADGRRVAAQMVAPNAAAVVTELQRQGWVPISVTESKNSAMNVDLTAWITGGGVKFKWQQRAEFARRLHQMLRAGISPSKALATLGEDAPGPVAAMCNEMSEKVIAGLSLSDAMKDHPRAFDEVTIAYIQSGEESGTLVQTTARLADMLAKRAALTSKIKAVTAYPKLVGGAIALLTTGIILFLVPMYAKIYNSFGATLPAPTRALMWFSRHLLPVGISSHHVLGIKVFYPVLHFFTFGMVALLIIAGVWYFLRATRENLKVGMALDRIRFKMPLLGKLGHLGTLQRWASTLGGALASGVPTMDAIDLSARSSGSRWHRRVAPDLAEAVRTGRTMSSEVYKHPNLYPPNVRTMLATGEQTGEMDTMLNSVANALDSDIDALVAGLSAKIEVALLLVLGFVVGGLLLILYMPILNLATTASKGLENA